MQRTRWRADACCRSFLSYSYEDVPMILLLKRYVYVPVQVFSSGAIPIGSASYWFLIVFVAGVIALAIAAMIGIIAFESFRAFRYSGLYISLT